MVISSTTCPAFVEVDPYIHSVIHSCCVTVIFPVHYANDLIADVNEAAFFSLSSWLINYVEPNFQVNLIEVWKCLELKWNITSKTRVDYNIYKNYIYYNLLIYNNRPRHY